jgi:hypothetical protein
MPSCAHVNIVLATLGFAGLGGSETYVLRVGEQLQRLGHEVTIHAIEGGPMADFATESGVPVSIGTNGLPERPDVVLVQDSVMAYELAQRWPETPQLFRAPSDVHDFQLPPQLPGVVGAVVVLSERMRRRIEALERPYEIVRLRLPVDTTRFSPLGEIGARPTRAVLLGNHLHGDRRRMLEEVWGAAGVECVSVGQHGTPDPEPAAAIAGADIVVGKARTIVEAMACGRAAYVLDVFGGDGWVTPDLYPAMEADNFAGQATDWTLSEERLAADLRAYSATMGPTNRDLALAHHSARDHAQALLEVMRRLAPRREPVTGPLRELSRLVRMQWIAERDAFHVRGVFTARGEELNGRILELEARNARLEERELEIRRLEALLATRRAQLGLRLGALADRLRGR